MMVTLITCIPARAIAQGRADQATTITAGVPYTWVDGDASQYFVRGSSMLAVKSTSGSVTLQQFDLNDLQLKTTTTTALELGNDGVINGAYELGGRYYLLFCDLLRDPAGVTDSVRLWAREIAFDEARLLDPVHPLVARSVRSNQGSDPAAVQTLLARCFSLQFSRDRSRMMVDWGWIPNAEERNRNFRKQGLAVFSAGWARSFSGEVDMLFDTDGSDLLDKVVDGNGVPYFLVSVTGGGSLPDFDAQGRRQYEFQIQRLVNGHVELAVPPFAGPKRVELWLAEAPNGTMAVGGYYTHGGEGVGADGVFLARCTDTAAMIMQVDTFQLTAAEIDPYSLTKKNGKGPKPEVDTDAAYGLRQLRLSYFLISDQGVVTLIGEQFISFTNVAGASMSMPGQPSTGFSKQGYSYEVHRYHDVFIAKLDLAGHLHWMKRLPKRQAGAHGKGTMGFRYIATAAHDVILFMDDPRNSTHDLRTEASLYKDGNSGQLTSYFLDKSSGSVRRSTLLDLMGDDGEGMQAPLMRRILVPTSGTLLMDVQRNKKEGQLVKATLITD